ncbi:hypothetical protein BSKO_08541 [Bryopsis sp. KO-2023]|nr:hypothetical protein BSKO_08541 [Bryopsis sp. KO-2023]
MKNCSLFFNLFLGQTLFPFTSKRASKKFHQLLDGCFFTHPSQEAANQICRSSCVLWIPDAKRARRSAWTCGMKERQRGCWLRVRLPHALTCGEFGFGTSGVDRGLLLATGDHSWQEAGKLGGERKGFGGSGATWNNFDCCSKNFTNKRETSVPMAMAEMVTPPVLMQARILMKNQVSGPTHTILRLRLTQFPPSLTKKTSTTTKKKKEMIRVRKIRLKKTQRTTNTRRGLITMMSPMPSCP